MIKNWKESFSCFKVVYQKTLVKMQGYLRQKSNFNIRILCTYWFECSGVYTAK